MLSNKRVEFQKQNVAASSVIASLFLTIIKLIVGLLTGSIGIISEAAHSALDLGAASITYYAVRASGKPADIDHQYGHGKIESFSALAETVLLFVTSGWIIYEAIQRLLFKGRAIDVTWYAFAVMIVSIITDFYRSRALDRMAKKTNSQALEADALHFKTDIWSSSVVIAGLVFVTLGIKGADALAALGVAAFVIYAGLQLARRTVDVLLDTAPVGMVDKIKLIVDKIDGVVSVGRTRIRAVGPSFFIDTSVSVSRKIPLEQVHEITKNIEKAIKKEIPRSDVVVHIKPVALKNETMVERVQMIVARHALAAHDIRVHNLDGKTTINFDLEVGENLNLGKAHEIATRIENALHYEFGTDTDVNIHIEPLQPTAVKSAQISARETKKVHEAIAEVKQKIAAVGDIHNISVQRVEGKLFITLHAVLDEKVDLEEAHTISSKIEYLIKEVLPDVERVVVHLEPNTD